MTSRYRYYKNGKWRISLERRVVVDVIYRRSFVRSSSHSCSSASVFVVHVSRVHLSSTPGVAHRACRNGLVSSLGPWRGTVRHSRREVTSMIRLRCEQCTRTKETLRDYAMSSKDLTHAPRSWDANRRELPENSTIGLEIVSRNPRERLSWSKQWRRSHNVLVSHISIEFGGNTNFVYRVWVIRTTLTLEFSHLWKLFIILKVILPTERPTNQPTSKPTNQQTNKQTQAYY